MAENIFLFVPNVIDYCRLVLAFTAFWLMRTNYVLASSLYLLSGFLDCLDGFFARMLNQCTKLGSMLDQLTDRLNTMCLMGGLCYFYPRYMFFFQFSMAVDIGSHWLHMQSSMMKGSESHKVLDLAANPILRHYYQNKKILFLMCSGNEMFFCLLYVLHFTTGPILPLGPLSIGLWTLLVYPCALISFMKLGISLLQLWGALLNIEAIDQADRASSGQRQKSN